VSKILTRLRYPKLILLSLSIFSGFLIYFDQNNFHFHDLITNSGFIGVFLAGFFLAHGFTMGPAVAVLLILAKTEPLISSALLATIGAILGNAFFYNLLRISYHDELSELSKLSFFKNAHAKLKTGTPLFVRKYILPVFAGFVSATPLPDEFSMILIKESKEMSVKMFTFFTGLFSIFGITIILLIGKYILN